MDRGGIGDFGIMITGQHLEARRPSHDGGVDDDHNEASSAVRRQRSSVLGEPGPGRHRQSLASVEPGVALGASFRAARSTSSAGGPPPSLPMPSSGDFVDHAGRPVAFDSTGDQASSIESGRVSLASRQQGSPDRPNSRGSGTATPGVRSGHSSPSRPRQVGSSRPGTPGQVGQAQDLGRSWPAPALGASGRFGMTTSTFSSEGGRDVPARGDEDPFPLPSHAQQESLHPHEALEGQRIPLGEQESSLQQIGQRAPTPQGGLRHEGSRPFSQGSANSVSVDGSFPRWRGEAEHQPRGEDLWVQGERILPLGSAIGSPVVGRSRSPEEKPFPKPSEVGEQPSDPPPVRRRSLPKDSRELRDPIFSGSSPITVQPITVLAALGAESPSQSRPSTEGGQRAGSRGAAPTRVRAKAAPEELSASLGSSQADLESFSLRPTGTTTTPGSNNPPIVTVAVTPFGVSEPSPAHASGSPPRTSTPSGNVSRSTRMGVQRTPPGSPSDPRQPKRLGHSQSAPGELPQISVYSRAERGSRGKDFKDGGISAKVKAEEANHQASVMRGTMLTRIEVRQTPSPSGMVNSPRTFWRHQRGGSAAGLHDLGGIPFPQKGVEGHGGSVWSTKSAEFSRGGPGRQDGQGVAVRSSLTGE